VFFQTLDYVFVCDEAGLWPRNSHYIQSNYFQRLVAKRFSYQAFYSVAPHRPQGDLARHSDPQSRLLRIIAPGVNCEQFIPAATTDTQHCPESCRSQQAVAAREALAVHGRALAGAITDQALSCARPLARRALIIARPPRVFIRALKPWRRLRLTILGWKVRFIFTRGLSGTKGAGIYRLRA